MNDLRYEIIYFNKLRMTQVLKQRQRFSLKKNVDAITD